MMKKLITGIMIFFAGVFPVSAVELSPSENQLMQQFQSQYESGSYYEFLYGLPKPDGIYLAKRLRNHTDGKVAYAAANIFIRYGYKEKAVPILARLIVSGRDKTDLQGRMGYDWLHLYGDKFATEMSQKVLVYMLENLGQYRKTEEIKRIHKFYLSVGKFEGLQQLLVEQLQEKINSFQ
ncbi:MAG: hypothetical protein ABFS56_29465 [Pseudomonadota bacterium]